MAGSMNPFKPAEDAWTRRDVMRNGFFSAALLCTLGPQSLLKGPQVVTSAGRRRSLCTSP